MTAGVGVIDVDGWVSAAVLLALVVLATVSVYGLAGRVGVAGPGAGRQIAVPFGSGFPPAEHAMSRFHPRWYPAAMLFLAFDMEMVFMYPWTRIVSTVGTSAVVEMFTFLAVLIAGVTYAWREGALRWT